MAATQACRERFEALRKPSVSLGAVVGLRVSLAILQVAKRCVGPPTLPTEALRRFGRKDRIDAILGIRRTHEIGAIARAILRIRDVTAEQTPPLNFVSV